MTYKEVSALYSLFITNVNNLTRRFGKAYFPNPTIRNVVAGDDIESMYKYIDKMLPRSDYEKYNGFLFPILIFKDGTDTFRIYDGCHRYVYTQVHPEVNILAVVLEYADEYELSIPTELCKGNYDSIYEFKLNGIKCSKVIIHSIEDFRYMYVSFADWLYPIIQEHDEWYIKANKCVNINSKLIERASRANDNLAPMFQYFDEHGIIRHAAMLEKDKSKEYIQSLYNLYSDNIWLSRNDNYIYIDTSNVFDIELTNPEWWNNIVWDKEGLASSIEENGIYFPIVYIKSPDGKYTLRDGLHRFFACKKVLTDSTISSKYLMIPNTIKCDEPIDLYVPKFIYDRYSYMMNGVIVSDFMYNGIIDSYIVTISTTEGIRVLRLVLERELNDMSDRGQFKAFDIKPSKFFNGGEK